MFINYCFHHFSPHLHPKNPLKLPSTSRASSVSFAQGLLRSCGMARGRGLAGADVADALGSLGADWG